MKHNSFNDLEHLELVARRIAESGIDITNDYAEWINVTFACASLGEAAREAYHTICRQYPTYNRAECDEKFDNCLRTGRGDVRIATLFQSAKEHGIDTSLPRGPRPKSPAQKKEERENRFQLMRQRIEQEYETRFNVWKNRVDIRELPSGEFKPLNERDLSTIFSRLQEQGLGVKISDVKAFLESRDFSHDFDAVADWLDSLKPYDPQQDPDYICDFFAGHLKYGDPENSEFYQSMFKKWFVGMVKLWKGLTNENPLMPVFCGPQHIGKTFFIRHILPTPLRDYYKEPSPRDPVDKDFVISLSEVVMIFLDEFSISSDMKSDAFKSIITSSQSNLRDAYGHFREVRQRKASLIGATNNKQFIRDSEGNRRYIGVDLIETDNLNDHPLPYEGAYAQALWLIENGFDPKPTQEESAAISEHNRDFMEPNDCEEALRVFVRHPCGEETPKAYSAGELMQELNYRGFHGKTFNANNVGKAMRRLGFEARKVKGYNKYMIVIADFSRLDTERVIDAVEANPVPF